MDDKTEVVLTQRRGDRVTDLFQKVDHALIRAGVWYCKKRGICDRCGAHSKNGEEYHFLDCSVWHFNKRPQTNYFPPMQGMN